MVMTGFNAAPLPGPHLLAVIRVDAATEQLVARGDFADLEAEHAVDGLRPVQHVAIDRPVPGTDAGEVLTALEAFDSFDGVVLHRRRLGQYDGMAVSGRGYSAYFQPLRLAIRRQQKVPASRRCGVLAGRRQPML